MRRTAFLLIAVSVWLAAFASAARRPHYGGVLRVELRASLSNLDPAAPETSAETQATKEHAAALVFEPLVRLDEKVSAVPALALTWQHSPDFKSWQFTLRSNIKFHDGTPFTTRTAVESLLRIPNPHWRVRTEGNDLLVFDSDSPLPNLPAELAQTRYAIAHGSGISISGTGPFQVASLQPGKQIILKANDDYWDSRPYLDSVEISLGRSLRDQMVDLELGRADVIEVSLDQARRAAQEGKRVVTSQPNQVFVLVFNPNKPGVRDERAREAIAEALDRAAITNVLLQKEGEPSAALLPEWMSGYAFLFPAARNLDRALQLRAEVVIPTTLVVNYDFSDPVAKAVAERVAVNAREVGINMQALGENLATRGNSATLEVLRVRYGSMDPATALLNTAAALSSADAATIDASKFRAANSPTTLYRLEQELLTGFHIVPIAQVPEAWGVSSRVRNWTEPREGGWNMADVWLEGAQTTEARSEGHP